MRNRLTHLALGILAIIGLGTGTALAAECTAKVEDPIAVTDPALCRELQDAIRDPAGVPLDRYEDIYTEFFGNWCHRDADQGWVRDVTVRDTGPYTATFIDGAWHSRYNGTHSPVVIWYSPEMYAWMQENRAPEDEGFGPDQSPVPDGAIIVKEMFPAPANTCRDVAVEHLFPTHGAAFMVRQESASADGWFWGYQGWTEAYLDWPADNDSNALPNSGFGMYCVNCHVSARDNGTFSALDNITGTPDTVTMFLDMSPADIGLQDATAAPTPSFHDSVVNPVDPAGRLGEPALGYLPDFLEAYPYPDSADKPQLEARLMMPPQTYDHVYMPEHVDPNTGQLLTSDQCLGCHDAGSTGLYFDMTAIDSNTGSLVNLSPYATWGTSPMGLAGRDPIFFAQLASETQTFHADEVPLVENTCLGCHGFLGQRQYDIDQHAATGECGSFSRELVSAVPWPSDAPEAANADYGALARDGISCMACHRMVLGADDTAAAAELAENACALERQQLLNAGLSGFGLTFTGSYLLGPSDELYGPFEDPKTVPMQNALDITPKHNDTIMEAELCGACHTVHLPVLHEGKTVGHIYEQLTYPEWSFSAYRDGTSPDGDLPHGAGETPQTCQQCHMPSVNEDGSPTFSKIASIQEFSRSADTAFIAGPDAIDLPVREGFARHDLVGLNLFLVMMGKQFPDIMGIRTQDPMMLDLAIDPLDYTADAIVQQAQNATATLKVTDITHNDAGLEATVTVENLVGHKFPSGVGFRRAFLTFEVLDDLGKVLWASGRTDGMGRLIDENGDPIAGEIWWDEQCTARIDPEARAHQPHFQVITEQSQAQIYQELVSTPGDGDNPQCGLGAEPAGQLTTSFLSICTEVKDNRLLPHGYLPEDQRIDIALALGANEEMAIDAGSTAVGDDPDYADGKSNGTDTLIYRIPADALDGTPADVRVQLHFQATPPFYLQDRFCTAQGDDRDRLYFMTGHLNLDGTIAEDWKLLIADTQPVAVP